MLPWWRFDFYYGAEFWVALVAAVLLVRVLGGGPRLRGWAMLACSAALLLAVPTFGARDLALVGCVAAVSFGVSRRLLRPAGALSERTRWVLAVLGVAAVLGTLVVFKYRWAQEILWMRRRAGAVGPTEYVFLVGVSYFSFKAVHVVVDSYKRAIPDLDPLAYLNYILFFPSFISGPIQRYPDFAPQMHAPRLGNARVDLQVGAERIVHGLFKKLVLVQILTPYILTSPTRPLEQRSFAGFLVGVYAYAAYAYLDFSGYSDLAIGSARLLGFELPENFSWPFLQKNIREFWTNWHMTLTSWLVDYVYWPLARKLREWDFFRARPVSLSVVCMIATFLACGAWHGESANFLIWGAYHGVGISILIVYQRQKRKIRNRGVQRYFSSRTSRVLGSVAAAHYFTFGTILFALDMDKLRTLASTLFH